MPEAPHSPAEPGGDPWSDIPAGGSIWFRESEHFFRPFSPLWETAWGPILHDTVKRATDDIGLPIGQLQFRLFHGYAYFRVVPFEGDRAERRQRREAALALCSDDLLSHWRSELLPRVQAHIDHMRQFDLRAASAEALEAHLDDALRRQDDAWYIHFYVFWVMMMLSFEYDAIAAEGGITGELLRAELVQDADNASLTGDNALAAVADAARRGPRRRGRARQPPCERCARGAAVAPRRRRCRARTPALPRRLRRSARGRRRLGRADLARSARQA